MVYVKVRETYDLHTTKNKMSVIAIHTPKPEIIKKNFPGLLMQCKAYRPVSCDVRLACASVLPLDPLGVGTSENDVAPEDVFNPILYKAISNKGLSQLEARITALSFMSSANFDVSGYSADVEVDNTTSQADEFGIYYGLLSNAHGWKHANPQSGLSMSSLRPLVFDLVANVGDVMDQNVGMPNFAYPATDGSATYTNIRTIVGKPKEMPFINCTAVSGTGVQTGFPNPNPSAGDYTPYNSEVQVPYIHCVCGVIIVPPSRLHELFYRMVVEWTIEFSSIRPIGEITDFGGLASLGGTTHYQNYNYESTKEAVTGDKESILESDSCMVSANVDIDKVM